MKILLAGNTNIEFGAEYYISKYLKKAGHDVTDFLYPSFDINYTSYNNLLFRMIHDIFPDLVICSKCPGLKSEDIIKLKKSGIKIIQWVFDKMSDISDKRIDGKMISRESWWIPQARSFDLVINPEHDMNNRYIKLGLNHHVLHEGVDIDVFHDIEITKNVDVIFAGQLYNDFRKDLVSELSNSFRFEHYTNIMSDALNIKLNSAKMSISTNWNDDENTSWSARNFEHMASGILLLTPVKDKLIGMGFTDDYVVYYRKRDIDDLKSKIRYYLDHEEERKRIAYNGMKLTRSNHSWEHRIKELFDILKIEKIIK